MKKIAIFTKTRFVSFFLNHWAFHLSQSFQQKKEFSTAIKFLKFIFLIKKNLHCLLANFMKQEHPHTIRENIHKHALSQVHETFTSINSEGILVFTF